MYIEQMDDWLNIPEGRKATRPIRLALLLGLTALLFLLVAPRVWSAVV
ncbi:MAG: hypothetical protein WCC57_02775 [Paracoccaceae bacterium]